MNAAAAAAAGKVKITPICQDAEMGFGSHDECTGKFYDKTDELKKKRYDCDCYCHRQKKMRGYGNKT